MDDKLLEQIKISVSEDNMTAKMLVPSACSQIEFQNILDLLSKNGIVSGINEENIHMILDEHIFDKDVEIATGEAAVDGVDARLEFFFDTAEKKPTPEMAEDGSVDQHELNLIELVEAGDLLIKKHPLIRCNRDGYDVYGKIIKAHIGKDVSIKVAGNVELSANGLEATAMVSGSLKWSNERVSIETNLHVRGDVDFATGDIKFYGDVEIDGNVLNDFKVKTNGNILIKGVVEAAKITAGGTVTIINGVLGRGHCYIEAGEDIISGHIEASTVIAGRDVYVSSAIRHSQVKAEESIICDKEDGIIFGGELVAGKLIQAKEIGTEIETVTTLVIGSVSEIVKKIKELNKMKKELEVQLRQITDVQTTLRSKLAKDRRSGVDYQRIVSMANHLIKINSVIDGQKQEDNKLESQIAGFNDLLEEKKDAKLSVEGKLFPGVRVSLGDNTKLVKEVYINKTVVVRDDEFYFFQYKDNDDEKKGQTT